MLREQSAQAWTRSPNGLCSSRWSPRSRSRPERTPEEPPTSLCSKADDLKETHRSPCALDAVEIQAGRRGS